MVHPLQISLLGRVAFQRNGEPLAGLTAVKAQALLIYLAVTGRPHTRTALAGILWSDVTETAAHNSLRVALTHLRQAAGDCIQATRQTVALAPNPPLWLDVTAFVQACSRLQTVDAGVPEGEFQSLRRAVHLYRGDFLAGFHVPYADLFEEWMVAERAYYSRLALDAMIRLAEVALLRGAWAEGIEDAQRVLALDPLHEEAHRLLMRLYAYSGQTPQALRHYEECVRLLDEELGVPPSGDTVALYETIRTRTLPLPEVAPKPGRPAEGPTFHPVESRPKHNVPHQTTPFVGRSDELAALDELLAAPNRRLVTIVAPGGMGKTRLAQEVALTHLAQFQDGVYFVPLAPLNSAEELAPAIADAVNYPMQGDHRLPQEQLLDFFRHKQILLVLDNFEHLLDGAALITSILQATDGVKILVTSRERINLTSETVLLLGGLSLPPDIASGPTDAADAVKLFVNSARRVAPRFSLTHDNWPAVVRICRLTYGMPLGIVLSAAWVSLLSVEEIADEIAHNLNFLEADLRDLPERQRSLAAVFAYTWRRLLPEEQEAFMRLSVFRNGFSRQAAQVVAGAYPKRLLGLADKALIQRSPAGRYEVHELLRQYGVQMLTGTGAAESAHTAHSRYFLHFLHTLEHDIKGRRQLAALAELEVELDNIRAAWDWALTSEDYATLDRSLEALHLFFALRGRNQEGGDLLWNAYQRLGPKASPLRWRVLARYYLVCPHIFVQAREVGEDLGSALAEAMAQGTQAEIGVCYYALGRQKAIAAQVCQPPVFDVAIRYLEQGLACFQTLDDHFFMARIARVIAICYGYNAATLEQHQALSAAGLEYARRAGSVVDQVTALGSLGWGAMELGQFADAEHYYREAMTLVTELNFPNANALVTIGLAYASFCQGKLDTAGMLAEDGLAISRQFRSAERECLALLILSLVASVAGDPIKALHLAEQSRQIGFGRYFRTYVDWTLALAYCGVGNHEPAWRHLQTSYRSVQLPGNAARVMAIAAVLLGAQGDLVRAAQVLGAVFTDRYSAHGWLEQWRPLTELQARLQAELGEDAYQALWDHGAHVGAGALAEELLGLPTGAD